MLRNALAGPGRTPDQTCQAVLDTLLPARPSDNIALLVARTRLLDPSLVADWEVPGDPAAVAGSEPVSPAAWRSGGWKSSPYPAGGACSSSPSSRSAGAPATWPAAR